MLLFGLVPPLGRTAATSIAGTLVPATEKAGTSEVVLSDGERAATPKVVLSAYTASL